MSVKKFKFVSPGIFLAEVDNSQLPARPETMGPIIVGRTRFGPGMTPVKINSFSEFVQVFGDPVPGGGSGDIWRSGNTVGPTYGAYAAQAYLRAQVGPVTMFRLLGETNPDASSGTGDETAGWITKETQQTISTSDNGGAYGLFIFDGTGSAAVGSLGAIFYIQEGGIALTGSVPYIGDSTQEAAGTVFQCNGPNAEFMLSVYDTAGPSGASTSTTAEVTSITPGPFAGTIGDTIDIAFNGGPPVTTAAIVADKATSETAGGEPFAIADAETLILSINGGPAQTVTFSTTVPPTITGGAATAAEVAAAMNAGLTGVSVTANVGGTVTIATDQLGSGATISLPTGTASGVLAFPAGTHAGINNVANLAAITATEVAGLIGALAGVGTATAVGGLITITADTAGPTGCIQVLGTGVGTLRSDIGLAINATPVCGTTVPGSNPVYKAAFNFDDTSDKYIRDIFNTNPQLSNEAFVNPTSLTQGENLYWLGESFEASLKRDISTFGDTPSAGGVGGTFAILLALEAGFGTGGETKQDYKFSSKNNQARTGWYFAQDRGTPGTYACEKMPKLFKIHAQDGGRWVQDNLKVSLTSIKASTNDSDPYGSFNIELRSSTDTDNVVRVVERFTNVNLNPNSENYVGLKVGDKYTDYDYTSQVTRQFGTFNNRSKYIRMEMNPDLETGLMDPTLLPFGVMGPPRFNTFLLESGSATPPATSFVQGRGDMPITGNVNPTGGPEWITPAGMTASVVFPSTLLRLSASDGGIGDPKNAYFGYQNTRGATSARHDKGHSDYLWPMPAGVPTFDGLTGTGSPWTEYQWLFSMDNIVITGAAGFSPGSTDQVYYQSGSRQSGASYTATGGSGGYKGLLKLGYDRFTSPFFGGFDGLDIIEAEPFRNGFTDGGTVTTNYAFNSLVRAINTIADPEYIECNLITIPGVTNNQVTGRLLDMAEDRADTLAIIDLPEEFIPFTDSLEPLSDRIGTDVTAIIDNLEARGINSSYGCAYYPWVQVKDTIRGNLLWVPPSVVVLGTFASSQAKSELWFAPAGFNRGGLTEGSAGIPVTAVSTRVISKNRDRLYEANINPIASFPSEGIVVFGQKTLQVTQSALDRINVRRLLIYIKKQVSRIASGILFDQNVQTTWNRFLGEVNPFLASVQSRLGLTEFKVILDSTTTTPDLIDQNILYAKIFLKPARAIEFIAIDFVITRTGASFED